MADPRSGAQSLADHVEHGVDVGAAPPVEPASTARMTAIGIGIVVVLAVLLVAAIMPRRAVQRELAVEAAAQDSAPQVVVGMVHRAATGTEVMLPGTIQALHEGAIYARVSGYVKRWTADIGSVVRRGDVLAEIDAPELEQEVQQAQSQLSQTRAGLGLARADLERWRVLASDSAVSSQEYDQKKAAYEAAAANTGAAEANLRRLTEMRQFTRVTAPFAGVVTARNVDLGSLITAAGATSAPLAAGGSGTGGGQGMGSLFRLAETDTVRTYITVPESYAPSITPGIAADVLVQEFPGRTLTGRVVRTARSLDAASRTLLTEVDIANPGFALIPGMYAQVRLHFARATPPIVLPASALVIRSDGPQVMVIDGALPGRSATVHFRPVQIARDYGSTVEIAAGVDDGTTIVLNPSAELVDGSPVRVLASPDRDRPAVATPSAVGKPARRPK